MLKKTEKTCTFALCALLIAQPLSTHVKAQENETLNPAVLPFVALNTQDPDPLATIKNAVLEQLEESENLDLDTIDMDNSRISIDSYKIGDTGMIHANVSIALASGEEDSIPGFAYDLSHPVILSIESDEHPSLLLKEEDITLKEGDSFSPAEQIAYISDPSGILPVLDIQTDLNTNAPGNYEVHYTVTNANGYKSEASLNVTVEKTIQLGGHNISLSEIQFADDGSIYGMFEAINAVRAQEGLYPFVLADETGLAAAAIRAQEADGFVSHNRPDGTYYSTIFNDVGMDISDSREILVAYGKSIETNLNWWLGHYGHRIIVLNSTFTTIAIGQYGNMWAAEIY